MTTTKKPSRSGKHVQPGRILRAPEESWQRWRKAAQAEGLTLTEWARRQLDARDWCTKGRPKDE